jgi:hypothetical protein
MSVQGGSDSSDRLGIETTFECDVEDDEAGVASGHLERETFRGVEAKIFQRRLGYCKRYGFETKSGQKGLR